MCLHCHNEAWDEVGAPLRRPGPPLTTNHTQQEENHR